MAVAGTGESAGGDWHFYGKPDEVILRRDSEMGEAEIEALCDHAREAARLLCEHYHTRSALKIAGQLGVVVARDEWQTADGRILFLGESLLNPPRITLNMQAIRTLIRRLTDLEYGESVRWNEDMIEEAITAHELFHIVECRNSTPEAELSAHVFVRALLDWTFSPLLFHRIISGSRFKERMMS